MIGGKRRGRTPLDPLLIEAPAKIDLRVSKTGYVDYTLQIDVPPEAVVEVRPVLTRREGAWYGKWNGAVRPDLEWRTELVETSEVTGVNT